MNEEVSPSTDPDATCEAVTSVQRCVFGSFCIYGLWDVIERALYHIWLAYRGILIVHVALHLVANADSSSAKQRGAYALLNELSVDSRAWAGLATIVPSLAAAARNVQKWALEELEQ